MYLLHYSNNSGSLEYVVVESKFDEETRKSNEVADATCDNVLEIQEILRELPDGLRSDEGLLPEGRRLIRK